MKCSNQLSISNIEESYTILLENEVQQFATTPSRVVQAAQSYYTDVIVHKGSKKRTDFTIGTIASANGITVTKSGSRVTFSVNAGTTITTDSGTFGIPIAIDGKTFSKTFSWSCAKQGQTGASGTPGTDAKAVNVTASSQIFKSTDGGLTFSPDTIKLTPSFQGGITFGKWQYSINGGTSWADVVSGQNGLTVASGVLTIAKTCAFYTKDITSIPFKCISNIAGYFDVVTVAKLYDVADIEIGGRNLAEKTNQGVTNWTWSMQSGDYTKTEVVEDGIRCCNLERGSAAQSGWSIIGYYDIGRKKLEAGKQYTISFEVRGSASVKFNATLLKQDGADSLIKQHDFISNNTVAGKWSKCIYVVTLKDQLPSSTDQLLYLTGMSSTPGSNYTFRNLKIENGNKATSWTPAPEDIQEQIETLETNITANTSSITNVEVLVDKQQKQIDAKVEQTDFTATIDGIRQDTALANRGINKWLVEIYPKFSLPTKNQGKYNIDAFWGNNIEPDQKLEVADGETHSSDIVQNNSILYGLTYVYFEEKTKIDTDFYHNNASTLYLNGSSVVSNATNGKSAVTLNFSKGWNIIEAVVNTTTGTKGFKFTTALSQHASCKSMNCHIARPTRRQTSQIDRIADIHIELDQITQEVSANAQSIIEKADGKDFMSLQSLVNETVNTVSEHIQEIGALRDTLADDYTSTADLKSQFNQKSGEVYQSVTAAYKTTIDQADELAKGLNKWIIEVYPKSGISSAVVPYPKEVLGISPSKILEYAESSLSTSMNIGDYYIGHAQTYVKFSSDYNFSTSGNSISLTTNGKGILYINGVEIKQTSSGSTTTISTGSFVAGWNVIEVWWTASTGNDGMRFSKNISSLTECTSMNCYHNFSGNAYQKMTATEISSKVDNNDGTYSQTVQKANMMDWLIKSGTSSTNFTLTDRTATLISDYINLKGLVKFDSLDSSTKALINNGNLAYSWTNSNGNNMNKLYSMVGTWTNNAISDSTYIQGGWIATNTITADKIAANTITANKIAANTITADKIAANTITADKLAIGSGANLYNLGYDTFDNITEDNLYYYNSVYATVSLNTTNVYYGKKSLCIKATGSSAYVCLGYSTNNYGCIPVQTGKYYRLSCYAKASSSATAYLYIVKHTGINNINSSLSSTYATVGTSWTRIELGFTVTSSYPYVSVRLQNNGGSGTTMYFDAIMIEEVFSSSQKAGPFKPAGVTIIDGGNIITESITADKIAANTITSDKIAANTITADKIAVNNLSTLSARIGNFSINNGNLIADSDSDGSFIALYRNNLLVQSYNNTQKKLITTGIVNGLISMLPTNTTAGDGYTQISPGEILLSTYNSSGSQIIHCLIDKAKLQSNGELISTFANGIRIVQKRYGFFIRNDGDNTWFMLTKPDFQFGTFGDYRPLRINNTDGAVYIATKLYVNAPMYSSDVYNTTGGTPNVYINSVQRFTRATSASKYKLDIKPLEQSSEYAYNILKLEPKQWFDKTSIENYAKNLTDIYYGENLDPYLDVESIDSCYGLIAEDVENAGLSKYCQYNAYGEVEGIMYDRLWTLLIPIIKDLSENLEKANMHINDLKEKIQSII